MKKRIIAFFLALVMLFSCLSLNIFAAASEGGEASTDSATPDHTDAQILDAIKKENHLQSTFVDKYSFDKTPDTAPTGNNESGKIKVEKLANGTYRYVYGAPTSSDGKGNSYVNLTSHYQNADRNLITVYDGYKAKGQSFVVQANVEFTDNIYSTSKDSFTIFQFSTYLCDTGRGTNMNALGNISGYFLGLKITEGTYDENGKLTKPGTLTLIARYAKGKSSEQKPIMTLTTGIDYTFAMHVDPSVVDDANGIYGVYDVYVNGDKVADNIGLLTKSENDSMDFSDKANVPYFVDKAFGTNYTFNGSTEYPAHFFIDKNSEDKYTYTYEVDAAGALVLDSNKKATLTVTEVADGIIDALQIDDDLDGIPNVYESLKDVTYDKVKNLPSKAIGTAGGVQDFCLAFVRVFPITGVSFRGNAFYFDNLIAYYTENGKSDYDYVDVSKHDYVVQDHAHNYNQPNATVPAVCVTCDAKTEYALDANGDYVCDVCVPVGGILSPHDVFNSGKQVVAAEAFNAGTKPTLDGPNGGWNVVQIKEENGNYYVAYGPKDTAVTGTSNAYVQISTPNSYRQSTLYNYSSYKGKGYVLTFDVKHDGKTAFDLLTLTCLQATPSEQTSYGYAPNMTEFAPIVIAEDGTILYRDGSEEDGTGYHYGVQRSTGEKLSTDTFRTITLHHTPKTNTYDLYVDGKCVAKDVVALTETYDKKLTWEDTFTHEKFNPSGTATTADDFDINKFTLLTEKRDGKTYYKMEGAKDFILSQVRFKQAQNSEIKEGKYDTEVFALDNIKLYYSEENIECAHTWTHTHSGTASTVTYTCRDCGMVGGTLNKTSDFSVLTGSGNLLTPEEIANTANINVKKAIEVSAGSTVIEQIGGGNNGSGTIDIETAADGNVYIKYGKTEQVYHDSDYMQIIDADTAQATILTQLSKVRGRSYTVSFDYMHYGNRSYNPLTLISYVSAPTNATKDANDIYSSGTGKPIAISIAPINVKTNGELTYRDGAQGANGTNVTVTDLRLNAGEFYNIVFHHTPATNSYDLFVNGKCVANDIQFLGKQDMVNTTWTATKEVVEKYVGTGNVDPNAVDENGYVKVNYTDFAPTYIRFAANGANTKYTSGQYTLYKDDKTTVTTSATEAKYALINGTDTYVKIDEKEAKIKDNTLYVYKENTLDLWAYDNIKMYYTKTNIECTHECTTSSKCDLCGVVLDYNWCDSCGGHMLASGAAVAERNATLGDEIGLNLYLNLSEQLLSDEDAKIVLTAEGREPVEYAVSELEIDETTGKYKVTLPLRSIDMARTVTVTATGTEDSFVYKTSLFEYLIELKKSDDRAEVDALVDAMLNYGTYAQDYFKSINSEINIPEKKPNIVLLERYRTFNSEKIDSEINEHKISGTSNADSVTITSASLVLASSTKMKVFFTAPENATVSINGDSVSKYRSEVEGEYYVIITKATPASLDSTDKVVISVDGSDVVSVDIRVLSAVQAVIANPNSSEKFDNLARAIYLYAKAADAYEAVKQ